jgi:hypothetical protein
MGLGRLMRHGQVPPLAPYPAGPDGPHRAPNGPIDAAAERPRSIGSQRRATLALGVRPQIDHPNDATVHIRSMAAEPIAVN